MTPASASTRDVDVHFPDLPAPFADVAEELERTDPGVLTAALVAGLAFRTALEEFLTHGVPTARKA